MENQENITQQNLPNATTVLVLGIISIVSCWCVGIVGLALGIIALVMAQKSTKLWVANAKFYTVSSYNNMKAGKICAIIGICLSSMYIAVIVVYFLIIGAAFSALPWAEMMNQSY